MIQNTVPPVLLCIAVVILAGETLQDYLGAGFVI
jgi:hypothetical protein